MKAQEVVLMKGMLANVAHTEGGQEVLVLHLEEVGRNKSLG